MTGSVLELDDIESGACAFGLATYVVFPAICCHKIQAPHAPDAARSRCQR